MWQKIKNILAVIGAVLSVALFTFLLFLLRRRDTDRRGSTDGTDRDSGIQEGIESCEERTVRIEDGITRAEDGIARCEERLQRAEDILRRAIEHSRKEKGTTEDSGDSD